MRTSHTAKIVDGFKKWSSDPPKHSNDGHHPGSTHPIVLNDPLTYRPTKPLASEII